MTKAGERVLEKRPGQADSDDDPEPGRRPAGEIFVGVGAARRGDRPPDEGGRADRRQAGAGDPVKNRNKHVRTPPPDRHMRRERARWIAVHEPVAPFGRTASRVPTGRGQWSGLERLYPAG